MAFSLGIWFKVAKWIVKTWIDLVIRKFWTFHILFWRGIKNNFKQCFFPFQFYSPDLFAWTWTRSTSTQTISCGSPSSFLIWWEFFLNIFFGWAHIWNDYFNVVYLLVEVTMDDRIFFFVIFCFSLTFQTISPTLGIK
jgi:hypothetical protein